MKVLQALLLAAFIFTGCKTTEKSTASTVNQLFVSATPCYGSCPVFKMTINADRTASYEAIRFNDEQQGQYQATIKKEDYEQLMTLLDKTGYTALQDEYKVPITDQPGMDLEIRYDQDKVKKIHDYGAKGTTELQALYNFVKDLRKTQEWKKVN